MSMRPIVLLVLALATTKTNAYRTCLRSLTRESSVHRVTVHTWRHTHQVTLQAGGPPPGVQSGGPPPGVQTGGPPGSGPPAGGGPPKGGPPPRTLAQKVVDAIFEAAFPLLYAFEDGGMLDSEKNLRVLWVRALLAAAGELNDDVASQLLPSASRWLVGTPLARTIWSPVLPKLEWIKQRTEFIDNALDAFLASHGEGAVQVVLIGSGYDTRALRYRASAATFFEVDLPNVLDVKEAMAKRYLASKAGDPASASFAKGMLGVDLNRATMAPPGVFAQLEGLGLSRDEPTLIVSEAVLFYLSPPAKQALLTDAAAFVGAVDGSQLVLTDNLAPFVRSPKKDDAAAFLTPMGLSLQEHDTLWGGAIQFIKAESDAS